MCGKRRVVMLRILSQCRPVRATYLAYVSEEEEDGAGLKEKRHLPSQSWKGIWKPGGPSVLCGFEENTEENKSLP